MPLMIDDDMEVTKITGTGYQFSGTKVSNLGASEFTLVDLEFDDSGSVSPFVRELEAAIHSILESTKRSPRADNILVRMAKFNDHVTEVHGFRPLSECDGSKYQKVLHPGGCTALYDAALMGVEAVTLYGDQLTKADMDVNAVVFVITDGADNMSRMTPNEVKRSIGKAVQSESLESILTVLIGVNVNDPSLKAGLTKFSQDVGFDQFVSLEDASPKTLAKLAKFVSQSITSSSQALGSGGASKAIDPNSLGI